MGIMFWLFITGLCLFCICWAVLFLTALSDAKKRNIPGYTLKLFLLWEYFVWDYLVGSKAADSGAKFPSRKSK